MTVAGCTTVNPGEATPAPTDEASSTDSPSSSPDGGDDLPSDGAPKVEQPLKNTSRFEEDPCSILTASQAQNLGLPTAGKEDGGTAGLDCQWFNHDTRGQVTIGFLTNNPRGLSAFYAANKRGEYEYFVELPAIEGYPAIASDIGDQRPEGTCLVQVGVTDQLTFHVDLQLSQANVAKKKDPCETGAMVAGKALETMKGA